jgi:hypothetical protein
MLLWIVTVGHYRAEGSYLSRLAWEDTEGNEKEENMERAEEGKGEYMSSANGRG